MLNNTKKILKLLTINEYRIIGSAGDKYIKYKSDVDAQEIIKLDERDEDTYNNILHFFQKIFNDNINNDKIWITDFKCGIQNGGVPIRWNIQDINNGYQIIEDRKIEFITTLQQQSIIKIDLIILDVDNLYHDISYNYYFLFKNFSTNPRINTIQELKTSLINDIKDLRKENRHFKSLKRLYSLYKLNNEEEKKIILQGILNSELGKFNSLINQLIIILDILEQKFRKPEIKDINYNIKYVYDNIEDKYKHLFNNILANKIINNGPRSSPSGRIGQNLINKLTKIINILNNVLNQRLIKCGFTK